MRVPLHARNLARPAAVLLLTIVLGALIAGCGGTKTLSHSALVAKANTACQTANSQASKLGAPTATLSALTGYATKLLPISRQLVTSLSALKPATADQASLDKLVSAIKTGNRGLAMMSAAKTIAQTSAASSLIVAQSVPKAADALGATTCAVSPSA